MTSKSTVPFVDLKGEYLENRDAYLAAFDKICSESSFILGGAVKEFEQSFAAYLGARHCVGVANGTDALIMAFKALGIGPGDEVLAPAHTFIATIIGILEAGAKPVLVDCDPRTFLLDLEKLRAARTPRTKAICPVHLYGRVCDMDAITAFAAEHGLKIVEDAAQAHGARWNGRCAGTFGHLSGFSFYPAKNLGCFGDGGAIVTNDDALAAQLRAMRNYGSEVKYHHPQRGGNSRLDSVQAAVLSLKLAKLEDGNRKRWEAASLYNSLLKGKVEIPELPPYPGHVFHLYVVRVPNREKVQKQLQDAGVQSGIHYPIPNHLQDGYRNLGYREGSFPVTEALCREILSLPMYPGITEQEIRRTSEALLGSV